MVRLKPDDTAVVADSLERDARSLVSLYHSVFPRMPGFLKRARRNRFLAKKLRSGELRLEVSDV